MMDCSLDLGSHENGSAPVDSAPVDQADWSASHNLTAPPVAFDPVLDPMILSSLPHVAPSDATQILAFTADDLRWLHANLLAPPLLQFDFAPPLARRSRRNGNTTAQPLGDTADDCDISADGASCGSENSANEEESS